MATTERDYYELLGVSRSATDVEIKKAFRALARELHPDVSDHPEAEERFKLVVEAYEVLSKQETRDLYDRYGHAGLRSGGFHSRAGAFPAGIHDGQRIRLGGEGHAGPAGGTAGDIYVLVRVKHDPRFVREGDDVYATLELTVTQAALGARVTVPTLAGDTELDLEPGTQPGQVIVLRGKGMPQLQGFGRGDQRLL